MSRIKFSRSEWTFGLLALLIALLITRGLVSRPTYTDAYYYFNAAERLAEGQGLTDTVLWTYIGAPEQISADGTFPSHLYWMPGASLLAALGMWLTGSPGSFAAAQWPFTLLFAALAGLAYWLGLRLGGGKRHAWVAGLLTLFSGFFLRYWGMTETFTPYALSGALALLLMGLAQAESGGRRVWLLWFLAGLFSGFGHLTRADGLLLLLVGLAVLWWPCALMRQPQISRRLWASLLLILGYLLVMGPWFLRNLDATGTILPTGGTDAIWFARYDELVNYPPGASAATLFDEGIGAFVDSRWTAITNNLGTFVAIEGLIVMTPLMLYGLWRRRADPFLRAFWLYALGLHLVMTLVFPLAGYRGGLFHSAAALVPWWAALGVVGLDDAVDWVARRRRRWKPASAKRVYSAALVVVAIFLSLSSAGRAERDTGIPPLYAALDEVLPEGARVMLNDPAALYYFTGRGGVVVPNNPPDVIPQIAAAYEVDYFLYEGDNALPQRFDFDPDSPPEFMTEIAFTHGRLYVIAP